MSAHNRFIYFILIIVLTLFVVAPSQAKISKCVLSNGHVIFTDIGCPDQPKKTRAKKSSRSIDEMTGAQRKKAIALRNKQWEETSKSNCLSEIDNYAKKLQPNFAEMIKKTQHKLVASTINTLETEFVHRVSFFFMADGQEWESSGNCHSVLVKDRWTTAFKRITTGKPFISSRKPSPKPTPEGQLAKESAEPKNSAAKKVTASTSSAK